MCSGLDVGANKMQYSFWVTHRCNTQQIARVVNARTEVYKKMRNLANELEMSFITTILPVYTVAEPSSTDDQSEPIDTKPNKYPFFRGDGSKYQGKTD